MKLVAVTSCPTGIAHSQMAAESLQTTGDDMGRTISVEVQGAMGVQDELTAEEIEAADAVIIAADTAVNRDRFEETPLIKATVKEAINDPERLIHEAVTLVESDSSDEGESQTDTTSRESTSEQTRVGGDPSKGLFARLKRLF